MPGGSQTVPMGFVWTSNNGINNSHWVNKDASKDHFLKATDINFVYSATMK